MNFLFVVIALVWTSLSETADVVVGTRARAFAALDTRATEFALDKARKPEPGDSVIEAMFTRWNNHVYRTATFVQDRRFPDGRRQTWYESVRPPGLVRIDIAPLDSGGTLLFREDSVYAGRRGRWTDARSYVRANQILFTDVYWQPTNATTRLLRAIGFDLSIIHSETWQGKPVAVIGAILGDTLSPQFWVDQQRLVVVRIIEHERQPGSGALETRVLAHTKAGEGWIESDVIYFEGGRELQHELSTEFRIDAPLDLTIFLPTGTSRPDWLRDKIKR